MVETEFIQDIVLDTDFEKIYPEQYQIPLEVKKRLLAGKAKFIYLINKETKEPICEVYYIPLDALKVVAESLQITEYIGKEAAYVYKNTTLPEYQGKGYGKLLTEFRIAQMKKEGYRYSVGHARHNRSIKQARMFGATPIKEIENWQGTDESVTLCVLDLRAIPQSEIDKAAIISVTVEGYKFMEKLAYQDGFRKGAKFAETKLNESN